MIVEFRGFRCQISPALIMEILQIVPRIAAQEFGLEDLRSVCGKPPPIHGAQVAQKGGRAPGLLGQTAARRLRRGIEALFHIPPILSHQLIEVGVDRLPAGKTPGLEIVDPRGQPHGSCIVRGIP